MPRLPHLVLLAGLLAAASAWAGKPVPDLQAPAGSVRGDDLSKPFRIAPAALRLTIDENGKPRDIRCQPTVPAPVCAPVSASVATWDFAPGRREGKPAAVEALLTVDLAAVPKPGGFGVQALGARLSPIGGITVTPDDRRMPPRYPESDMRRGREGRVSFEVVPDQATGRYRVLRTWFDDAPAKPRDSLVIAATQALAQWPAGVLPPDQLSTCIAIEFTLGHTDKAHGLEPRGPCQETFVEGFAMPVLKTDVVHVSI